MKEKLLKMLLTFLFIGSLAGMANATMIGAPVSEGTQGNLSIGTGISLWKQTLEDNDDTYDFVGTRILITPTYSITNQFDVSLKLGMVNACFKIGNREEEVKTDMKLAFGTGIKFTFYEADRLKVGTALQLLMWSGEDEITYGSTNYKMEIADAMDIDIATGANYAVNDTFSVYGGLTFGKRDGEIEYKNIGTGQTGSFDIEEKNLIGLFCGGDYKLSENINISAETQILSETSFTLMANFSF